MLDYKPVCTWQETTNFNINYLLTESEVLTGKSQTETLPY